MQRRRPPLRAASSFPIAVRTLAWCQVPRCRRCGTSRRLRSHLCARAEVHHQRARRTARRALSLKFCGELSCPPVPQKTAAPRRTAMSPFRAAPNRPTRRCGPGGQSRQGSSGGGSSTASAPVLAGGPPLVSRAPVLGRPPWSGSPRAPCASAPAPPGGAGGSDSPGAHGSGPLRRWQRRRRQAPCRRSAASGSRRVETGATGPVGWAPHSVPPCASTRRAPSRGTLIWQASGRLTRGRRGAPDCRGPRNGPRSSASPAAWGEFRRCSGHQATAIGLGTPSAGTARTRAVS